MDSVKAAAETRRLNRIKYRREENRLQSFTGWRNPHQSPAQLAENGFYYTKDADMVTCFECGLRIYDWQKGDIPSVEHARWEPACLFIRNYECGNIPIGTRSCEDTDPNGKDECGIYESGYDRSQEEVISPGFSELAEHYEGEPILRIAINLDVPKVVTPGTEVLFLYWKNRIRLDLAKTDIDIWVPPEWRSVYKYYLEGWMTSLRKRPYEDAILGGTLYHWDNNVIRPDGQEYEKIAFSGEKEYPKVKEGIPLWAKPAISYSDGSFLPVKMNVPMPKTLGVGIEKYFGYWQMALSPLNGIRTKAWVPPEWRQLNDLALQSWKLILNKRLPGHFELGGVKYQWIGDNVVPIGQKFDLIHWEGCGILADHGRDEITEVGTSPEAMENYYKLEEAPISPLEDYEAFTNDVGERQKPSKIEGRPSTPRVEGLLKVVKRKPCKCPFCHAKETVGTQTDI